MARLSGYASAGVLNRSEAPGLREAAVRLFGESKAATCRWLNGTGHRTTRGGVWRPETLDRVLSNPRIAGLDSEGNPLGYEETVLEPELYQRLMAHWAEQRTQQGERREAYEYLLTSGASACGGCGWSMIGARVDGDAAPSYRCPTPEPGAVSCGSVRMNADRLETGVAEEVLADLMRPGSAERLLRLQQDVREEVARLDAHVGGGDERLKSLKALRGNGTLVESAFVAADKETRRDLRDARARLRSLRPMAELPVSDVVNWVQWWQEASRDAQRALIGLIIRRVHVLPSGGGRHLDPMERVRIDWRLPAA
ncbi:recombinase family protein [Streptomyces sp. NPDC048696]|uniref:recombinase family protein n=1 Tax=Streptomyces sp. NPDC048696 TaxID=3365585 RepID=UPI00371D7E89